MSEAFLLLAPSLSLPPPLERPDFLGELLSAAGMGMLYYMRVALLARGAALSRRAYRKPSSFSSLALCLELRRRLAVRRHLTSPPVRNGFVPGGHFLFPRAKGLL
jgi:hypothetical protein